MDKKPKTMFVLGILICLLGEERMFDGAIVDEITGKNYDGMGMTGTCLISGQRGIMNNGR